MSDVTEAWQKPSTPSQMTNNVHTDSQSHTMKSHFNPSSSGNSMGNFHISQSQATTSEGFKSHTTTSEQVMEDLNAT